MSSLRRPIATRGADVGDVAPIWQDQAACRNFDPDEWFRAKGTSPEAREVCVKHCPVRARCLEMALNDPLLTFGMYGGYTPDERRSIRRRTREGRA